MLKNRPPLLDEVSNVAVTETTEDMGTKAKGSGETAEVTSEGRTAETETDTKENKNTTAAEKDKQPMTDAPREESTEAPHEENSGEPQEENNEPEGRENVTTTAKPIQPNKATTTKAQTTQKPTTVTTKEPVVYEPTEPVTERPTPEHDPGYIPTLTWYPEDGEWIMSTLSGLSYTPWEYDFHVDGRPPEGYIKGSDGNSYELYFTLKAVNRNGRERAPMPDEIYNYFKG